MLVNKCFCFVVMIVLHIGGGEVVQRYRVHVSNEKFGGSPRFILLALRIHSLSTCHQLTPTSASSGSQKDVSCAIMSKGGERWNYISMLYQYQYVVCHFHPTVPTTDSTKAIHVLSWLFDIACKRSLAIYLP